MKVKLCLISVFRNLVGYKARFNKVRYAKPAPPNAPTKKPEVNCAQPSSVSKSLFVNFEEFFVVSWKLTLPHVVKHKVKIVISPTADRKPPKRAISEFLRGPCLSKCPTNS